MTSFIGRVGPEAAINGMLLSLILDLNGRWVSAQDFANMPLSAALEKARTFF
jgi:hypothetical protein